VTVADPANRPIVIRLAAAVVLAFLLVVAAIGAFIWLES
jgi:hypothetical protein